MTSLKCVSPGPCKTLALLGVVALLSVPHAFAGPARGANPQKPPTPAKPGEPPQGSRGGGANQPRGWIISFTPTTGGEEEDLIGVLKFKPEDKDAKALSLRIHRRDDLKCQVGDLPLDRDSFTDLLWKNLYCTVTWALEAPKEGKKKSTQKELRSLHLETVDVSGTVDEIGEDFVVVTAKPIKGDWPDVDPNKKTSSPQGSTPAKVGKPRKLKLKSIEKISTYLNLDGKPADSSEYQVGDKVDVILVYGKAQGILVTMRHPKSP